VCLCSHEKWKLRYLVPALGDQLVVDGWASPAHPSGLMRVFDGILLGFGWASDERFRPMAWSPVPPGSPSCRGGPLERHRVILGRLGRFVFRNPAQNHKAMSLATSRTCFGHTAQLFGPIQLVCRKYKYFVPKHVSCTGLGCSRPSSPLTPNPTR